MSKTVMVIDEYGERYRIKLPEPFYKSDVTGQEDFTGVWITGLYYGSKTGRMIAETYSIWDDGTGACIGKGYTLLSKGDFLRYCRKVGVEVPEKVDKQIAEEL